LVSRLATTWAIRVRSACGMMGGVRRSHAQRATGGGDQRPTRFHRLLIASRRSMFSDRSCTFPLVTREMSSRSSTSRTRWLICRFMRDCAFKTVGGSDEASSSTFSLLPRGRAGFAPHGPGWSETRPSVGRPPSATPRCGGSLPAGGRSSAVTAWSSSRWRATTRTPATAQRNRAVNCGSGVEVRSPVIPAHRRARPANSGSSPFRRTRWSS